MNNRYTRGGIESRWTKRILDMSLDEWAALCPQMEPEKEMEELEGGRGKWVKKEKRKLKKH